MYKLDWKPDPQETEADPSPGWTLPVVYGEDVVDLEDGKLTPISYQGNVGSCVGNAAADALEVILAQEGQFIQLSRLFLYWNARNYTYQTDYDNGTYIRDCFKSLKQHGVCSEELWPYVDDGIAFRKRPPVKAYMHADANKIDDFYAITQQGDARVDRVEHALRCKCPVVFGTLVNRDFFGYKSGIILPPTGDTEGGHAMVVVGMKKLPTGKRIFKVRNSWGAGWGEGGYGWFDESYISWANTRDLWVPVRVGRKVL